MSFRRGINLIVIAAAGMLVAQSPVAGQPDQKTKVSKKAEITNGEPFQTKPGKAFPNVKIKNFGKMDEKFYRGGQPAEDEYQALKDLGVKTVIDLRDDPTDYEKTAVETLGMRYVNIPMSDKKYPSPASIDEFLKLADNPKTGIFFVHCEGGRHRTGVIVAVYRLTKYGWSYDQVYQEMKNYDFYTRWGHGAMKDFVVDYAAKLNAH